MCCGRGGSGHLPACTQPPPPPHPAPCPVLGTRGGKTDGAGPLGDTRGARGSAGHTLPSCSQMQDTREGEGTVLHPVARPHIQVPGEYEDTPSCKGHMLYEGSAGRQGQDGMRDKWSQPRGCHAQSSGNHTSENPILSTDYCKVLWHRQCQPPWRPHPAAVSGLHRSGWAGKRWEGPAPDLEDLIGAEA